MAYYKTNAPEVLAAWKEHQEKSDRIIAAGRQFAARFEGATALFCGSVMDAFRFYGLKFKEPMDVRIWTKPDYKTQLTQFPRRSVAPGVKGEERKRLAAELEKLREEYKAHAPEERADWEPFLNTMGLGFGQLFFSTYKQITGQDDGFIYIETSAKPSGVMVEILGSEFEAVEKSAK